MTDSPEVSSAAADQGSEDSNSAEASGFQAITSQEELDKIIGRRLARSEAKYSDYDDLKSKAEAFDKAEADKLSEIDKATKRAEKAERERDAVTLDHLRHTVATEKGVPSDLVSGTTREEMESSADALLNWRGSSPVGSPAPVKPNPQQGNPGSARMSGRSAGEAEAIRRGWIKPPS